MSRAMFSPIIRSIWLYLQYLVVFTPSINRLLSWMSWNCFAVSFQEYIWEINVSSWFYCKKFITIHGHMNVIYSVHTGWSKSLCALDEYSTSSGEQRRFDHPVLCMHKRRKCVCQNHKIDALIHSCALWHCKNYHSVYTHNWEWASLAYISQ